MIMQPRQLSIFDDAPDRWLGMTIYTISKPMINSTSMNKLICSCVEEYGLTTHTLTHTKHTLTITLICDPVYVMESKIAMKLDDYKKMRISKDEALDLYGKTVDFWQRRRFEQPEHFTRIFREIVDHDDPIILKR